MAEPQWSYCAIDGARDVRMLDSSMSRPQLPPPSSGPGSIGASKNALGLAAFARPTIAPQRESAVALAAGARRLGLSAWCVLLSASGRAASASRRTGRSIPQEPPVQAQKLPGGRWNDLC